MSAHPSRSQLLRGAAAASTLALWPTIGRGQTLEKVRFAGVPTDDLANVYYAINKGLYKRAGLEVEFVPTSSGTAATTAVIGGTYEIGKGSLIASLVAHLRGLPLTIIGNGAMWNPKNPFSAMVVAVDAPYKTAADFNGKTCAAAALNDLNQLAINAWVDQNGGDIKTLRWVEIPNSAAGPALAEHRIDVAILNEPQLQAAVDRKQVRVFAPAFSAIAPSFAFTVYFAQPDWAKKNADVVKRFLRVTYEAAQYTNAHHAETAEMVSEMTKVPLATIQHMTRVDAATNSDPALIQPAIDAAAKYKNIARAFPAKDAYFSG